MNSTKPGGTARIADRRREYYFEAKAPILGMGRREGQTWRTAGARCIVPLILLLILPTFAQAQFEYTVENGTVTINKYTGSGGDVAIPDTINGLPVTEIGDRAFTYNTSLTHITIGNGVTDIGPGAFALIQCPGGRAGTYAIPNSVTTIEGRAFSGCTGLTSVTIPSGVTSIEQGTFRDCTSLTRVTIPDSVIAIWGSDGILLGGPKGIYPSASAETDDPDQDGLSNYAEMLAGTDPTDRYSLLTIDRVPRPNDLTAADQTTIGHHVMGSWWSGMWGCEESMTTGPWDHRTSRSDWIPLEGRATRLRSELRRGEPRVRR